MGLTCSKVVRKIGMTPDEYVTWRQIFFAPQDVHYNFKTQCVDNNRFISYVVRDEEDRKIGGILDLTFTDEQTIQIKKLIGPLKERFKLTSWEKSFSLVVATLFYTEELQCHKNNSSGRLKKLTWVRSFKSDDDSEHLPKLSNLYLSASEFFNLFEKYVEPARFYPLDNKGVYISMPPRNERFPAEILEWINARQSSSSLAEQVPVEKSEDNKTNTATNEFDYDAKIISADTVIIYWKSQEYVLTPEAGRMMHCLLERYKLGHHIISTKDLRVANILLNEEKPSQKLRSNPELKKVLFLDSPKGFLKIRPPKNFL